MRTLQRASVYGKHGTQVLGVSRRAGNAEELALASRAVRPRAMTKSKKRATKAQPDHDRESVDSGNTRTPGQSRKVTLAVLAALLIVGSGYVAWHRRKDPARRWALQVEISHEQRIQSRLRRCFGGSDAAAIRRLLPEVRRGIVPAPLRACRGTLMSELVVTPMEFSASLAEPPESAESAKVRERDKLERLRGSLAQLQRVIEDLPSDGRTPISDDQRDRLASALEDVAVDVDSERRGLQDLVRAAESGASLW